MPNPKSVHHSNRLLCANRAAIIVLAFFLSSCALRDGLSAEAPGEHGDFNDAGDVSYIDSESPDSETSDSETLDGASDIQSLLDTDGSTEDVEADTSAPFGCQNIALGEVIQLDTSGRVPQFNARAAFDESGVWIVYVRVERDTTGGGDAPRNIFATRVGCDGSVTLDPVKINTKPVSVESPRPSIDIKDGTVYFVWGRESEGSFQIGLRTFTSDGEALLDEEMNVDFRVDSAQIDDSKFRFGDVVGLSGERAVVAAAGKSEFQSQVIIQQIDKYGASNEAAIPAHLDSNALQTRPSLTAVSTDKIWLSWSQSTLINGIFGGYYINYRSISLSDLDSNAEIEEANMQTSVTKQPRFARPIRDAERVYFVFETKLNGVQLVNAATNSELSVAGENNDVNSFPSVVATPNGGAVAWYRSIPGGDNTRELLVRAFEDSNGSVDLLELREIANDIPSAAGNILGAPIIVYVGQNRYFFAWHAGSDATDLVLQGSFVEL